MSTQQRLSTQGLTAATLACVVGIAALAVTTGVGAKSIRKCKTFANQAAAQDYLLRHGGGPGQKVGGLDSDSDGVACERLGGPYKGFVAIAYQQRQKFLYGFAAMPEVRGGPERFACLEGNANFPDGPRRLNIYRVGTGKKHPLLSKSKATEPNPQTGRFPWKIEAKGVKGRFYAEFEAATSTTGEKTECPAFRSRAVRVG
jgi:hypothetical protein